MEDKISHVAIDLAGKQKITLGPDGETIFTYENNGEPLRYSALKKNTPR